MRTWLPWIAGAVGLAATLYLFYPGFMVSDSAWQLEQAVTGEIDNAHPPVMVRLWALTNHVIFGPGGMFVLQCAAYWAGLALIAAAGLAGAYARVAFVLGVGFFPPLLGILATVWKDSGTLAALMLTSGLMLAAHRRRSPWPALAALPFLFYATAVRFPNGLAVLPLLWPISQSLLPARVREGRGTAPLRAGAFVALLVTLAFLTLAVSLVGVRRVAYFTCVPLWDLAQISLRTNELLVPKAAITLPQLDLARLEWISRENRCDYRRVLWEGRKTQAIGWTHLTAAEAREVVARWLEAIAAHPRAYFDHRLRVTARMLFFTDLGTHGRLASKVVFGGHQLAATESFEHAIVFSERPGYPLVERLFQRCAESLLCRPWPYLLVATAVFASGLRRPGAHVRFARTLAASGLLSVAPLPVIAPSTDFRYAVWLVAAALIGAVFALRPSGDQAR